ncbi:MAG: chromosome segregation protein SMC [Gemmatimonadota bacterium]|nr:chromosome segregation protein SMC [Gemmatimonadota bacterium]
MKLKSLRLHGFKSFPDPTRLEFHEGITAIVGPNGCGKSNIGDAVRWVLGEQRPTVIRGAKMEEVIFQGTVARRSVNRGSVSMIVTNEDGALATPFQEVEIGRTVHRDGGSDYRLNRAACRLRDIVDLCRDTGLGANAYSVIEIRMIDAILSERTDERRALFEEAAGIGRYKDRRRSALRRLETSEIDLQRVEDVIAEVQTKVRSLARQKGKAERYRQLRERRLAVEVAVVRGQLEGLGARLDELDAALESDREDAAGMAARLAAAEAELERARLEQVEAERIRGDTASRLDAAAAELSRIERDVAVANERIANWKRRLVQIGHERSAQSAIRARAEDERVTLAEEHRECKADFTEVQADLTYRKETAADVRERLSRARHGVRTLEEEGRALAGKAARTEGNLYSAGLQATELERRLERLQNDAREGAGALRELESQGDLFSDRSAEAGRRAGEAVRAVADARRRLAHLRERLSEARDARVNAEALLSSLEAERDALGRVEAPGSAEAVAQAARAALPECVHGLLGDFIHVQEGAARGADRILGRFAAALVVRGERDIERIARWYREDAAADAALIVLPAGAAPEPRGALPGGVSSAGEGAAWVRGLLGGARARVGAAGAGDGSAGGPKGGAGAGDGATASAPGTWTDARGAVHLFPAEGAEGRLERRERLDALAARIREAAAELEEARDRALALEEEHRAREAEVDEASERVLTTRDEARAAEANAVAQTDRRERLRRRQGEIARQVEGTRTARDRALERTRAAESEGAELRRQEGAHGARLEAERAALAAVEAEWEEAREAEAEASIRAARLESELQRLAGRMADTGGSAERATARLAELEEEDRELDANLARVRTARGEGQAALEGLFAQRDELRRVAAEQDRAVGAASEAARGAERGVREIRADEREAVGRRHGLEMEAQEIRNQVARITERLEAEWNRPAAELLAAAEDLEGAQDELREELDRIVAALSRIGPVNMLAFEEHAEESARLEFMVSQREDLVSARDDLRAAIRRINTTATERFMESFEAITENFLDTFRHLFSGGEAQLRLSEPDNPLESPIEIHASPEGKRTQRIDQLSGGERALTALSLLFGIYLVKPSPFCVLDEVDAPLDDSNITRFIRLLQGFKARTQFVVITHNPRTIEAADWIYGVTMEEPGVSSVVGVRLEAPPVRDPAA